MVGTFEILYVLVFLQVWYVLCTKNNNGEDIRGGRKLLLPFIVFSVLGYMVNVCSLFCSNDRNWIHYILTPMKELVLGGSVGGNDVLWFLTTLFLVQVAYNEIVKRKVGSWRIVTLSLAVAFGCHILGVSMPAYLVNGALGLAMYALGHLLRKSQYKRKVFCGAFIVYIVIMLGYASHIDLRTNTLNEDGSYILALLFSVSGCISVNYVFKRLPMIPLLNYIGRKSMDFYVMHMLVLEMMTMLPWKVWNILSYEEFFIMCIACLVIPAVIGRLLEHSRYSWVLGKVQSKKNSIRCPKLLL